MITYTVVILGRLDNLNDYINACRCNRNKGNKVKEANQDICKWHIKNQLRGVHIEKPVQIHFVWYEKNTKRDLDNVASFGQKVIQDALVECGVLKDDGWKCVTGFTHEFFIDQKNPRIEVTIECKDG